MQLFYASGLWYEIDEEVAPGSWGRAVLGLSSRHGNFGIEMAFELVRLSEFGELPSRLTALMLSENEAAGRTWQDNARPNLYELELPDHATTHRADVRWLDRWFASDLHSAEAVRGCARGYWAGEEATQAAGELRWEILTPASGRVTQRLT